MNSSVMNVNCYYIVYFSVKSFYPHFRSFETYSCITSYCAAFYLSTFSHDTVRILTSPESIAGGASNCKAGQLITAFCYKNKSKLQRVLKVGEVTVPLIKSAATCSYSCEHVLMLLQV